MVPQFHTTHIWSGLLPIDKQTAVSLRKPLTCSGRPGLSLKQGEGGGETGDNEWADPP